MRRLAVAVLLAAGAHASTGGKPRSDLPPLFLVPSLCGSRIRAWSVPSEGDAGPAAASPQKGRGVPLGLRAGDLRLPDGLRVPLCFWRHSAG